MVLGLSIGTFTLLHVVISLIGIATGVIALLGMLGGRSFEPWTSIFLITTLLTTLTGFLFPITAFTPALAVGALSTLILLVAFAAYYAFRARGFWRPVYVVTAVFALYLNTFVAVVQAFQKLAILQPLAPTQSEPPFLAAQGAVLVLFLVVGAIALLRFDPAETAAA